MTQANGGCTCGAIQISTTATPKRVGICHCLNCRKHHGAVLYAAAIFDQSDVTITGDVAHYYGRYFCRSCGSSVFAQTDDEIEIHLGSFDKPNQFTPTYETWIIRREPWLPEFPNTQKYKRDRL